MGKYILRLDDAAPRRDIEKWDRIEVLLDYYGIKPLVGVIPNCKDIEMQQYNYDENFWNRVKEWEQKGWTIALHGYEHVYCTKNGGINPVNYRSEFAGVSLEEQKRKIREGMKIFKANDINTEVFFAPSHTFDMNTIEALKSESNIKVISDTVANDIYYDEPFYFVPQQSGKARKMPFRLTTFCYHPNIMQDNDFEELEQFIKENESCFVQFSLGMMRKRRISCIDKIYRFLYFARREINCKLTKRER